MAASNTFDAIVVGSGMTGGWAAKELTEKGLKTLVLERGRNVRHITDYTTALKDPWELPYNNRPTNADRKAQPIQSTLYLYDQSTKQFLVDDTKYPYDQAQPFNWYRGYQVGGRSLMWARHVFRYSDLDFTANQREGVGIDSHPLRGTWRRGTNTSRNSSAPAVKPGPAPTTQAGSAAAVRDDGARETHQARIRGRNSLTAC